MSYAAGPYSPRDYRRTCDYCGVLWNRSKLQKREGPLFLCPDCDERWTALEKDRIDAGSAAQRVKRVIRVEAQPRNEVGVYAETEGRMFNFLDTIAPNSTRNVTNGTADAGSSMTVTAAGETIIYFYNLIQENKRNQHMLDRARARMAELADWLLEIQAVTAATAFTGTQPLAATTSDPWYGAFIWPAVEVVMDAPYPVTSFTVYSRDVATGLLALVRAYETLGDSSYLDGARAAASCLRVFQRSDLPTFVYGTTAVGGTGRRPIGMFTHSIDFEVAADVGPA